MIPEDSGHRASTCSTIEALLASLPGFHLCETGTDGMSAPISKIVFKKGWCRKMSIRREKQRRRKEKAEDVTGRKADGDEGGSAKKRGDYDIMAADMLEEFGDEFKAKSVKELFRKLPLKIPHSQCLRLTDAFSGGPDALRNNLVSRLIYATGIKPDEEASLNVEDVDFERESVRAHPGGAGSERYIFIDPETLAMLKAWIKGKQPFDSLFGLTLAEIERIVKKAAVLSGVDDIYGAVKRTFTARSLRHQFALRSCDNGMSPYTLKNVLGQKSFATTAVYGDVVMAADLEEYKATGPLARVKPGGSIGRYGPGGFFVPGGETIGRARRDWMQVFRVTRSGLYESPWEGMPEEWGTVQVRKYGLRVQYPYAVPTRDECLLLMTAFKEGKLAFRNNLIIRVLYVTGLRVGEEAAMIVADIDFDDQTIFVRSRKKDRNRYVCVDEETLSLLKTWVKGHGLTDSVFGLGQDGLEDIVDSAGEITGLAPKYAALHLALAPYCFRHSFATHCYENGMNLHTLQKLMGHEYPDMTLDYVEMAEELVREEFRRTAPFAKKEGK